VRGDGVVWEIISVHDLKYRQPQDLHQTSRA
jgi:hypothetical protein